jgi:hypothetical protein
MAARGSSSFTGNVGENQPQRPLERDEVVPVSPDCARGNGHARDSKSRNKWRAPWQQSLLNRTGLFGFAAHEFALLTLIVETAGIVHGDSEVRAQALQQTKLRIREGVQLAMRGGEYAD